MNGLVLLGFLTKIVYAFFISPCATCLAHLIFLDLVTLILGDE